MATATIHTTSAADDLFDRHRGPVTCVAGIPGRRAAVSSAYDGAVAYIDLEARSIELLGYHDHLVNRITVSPDGSRAASTSSDFSISIWDLDARVLQRRLFGHSDDVEDFVFVDNSVGVSVSRDCRILVWDLESGSIVRVIEGHEKDVLSVVYHDGRIYTSGDDMTLRVWDLTSGRLLHTWGPFEQETDSCAIDPIRGHAVLGCDDGSIRVFDLDTGEEVTQIDAHASGIKKVATSPSTGDIFSAAYDQKVLIWDAKDFKLRAKLEPHAAMWERSFNWSPDGARLLAGTFDGTVLEWDAASGAFLGEIGDSSVGNACLNDVDANAAGEIAVVSDDGRVRVGRLSADKAEFSTVVEPAAGRVLANAVCLDDPGRRLLVGSHNQMLHIWDRDGTALTRERSIPIGEGPINCIRVCHHSDYEGVAVVACYSGALVLVDPDGNVQRRIRVHEGAVKAHSLHPQRPLGVSCSADGALLAWDFEGHLIRRYPGHMAIVDDVDLDPTGRFVASVSRDFTLKVYELESGRLAHSVSLGRRSPKSVCFPTPDTVVVTNYWGELLRVELPSERVTRRAIAQNGISGIASCGSDLIAVSYDGTAHRVRGDDLSEVQTLREMRQRLQPSALIP
jgi:WD40 repeat protein